MRSSPARRSAAAFVVGAAVGAGGAVTWIKPDQPAGLVAKGGEVETYYAPAANLEAIDVELIGQARRGGSVDLAAFVLSDPAVIGALDRAALRGVKIRIYLDPEQLGRIRLSETHPLVRLSTVSGVQMRVKDPDGDLMHMKGYAVDGALVRTGSANLSVAGLRYQDNDLVIIRSPTAAARWTKAFDAMWVKPGNRDFAQSWRELAAQSRPPRF